MHLTHTITLAYTAVWTNWEEVFGNISLNSLEIIEQEIPLCFFFYISFIQIQININTSIFPWIVFTFNMPDN